jgi:hypothetical protein
VAEMLLNERERHAGGDHPRGARVPEVVVRAGVMVSSRGRRASAILGLTPRPEATYG